MSRVGKRPVPIPPGVEVRVEDGQVTVKGPKGTLSLRLHPDMRVRVEDGVVRVERPTDSHLHKALHGTTRALINNMVVGVSQGYSRTLEVIGVGYRVQQQGDRLVFSVGYSHPVEFRPPPGVTVTVESANRLTVSGPDKQAVGQVAALIRAIRPPDPYKGKGIRYADEVLHLKPGKAAARKK